MKNFLLSLLLVLGILSGSGQAWAQFGCPSNPTATLPFRDTFDGDYVGNPWSHYLSNNSGRVRITNEYGPRSGDHLVLDRSPGGSYTLNEAILYVNLAGHTGVKLGFWHKGINDEMHPLPASFQNHANGDGVAISADGTNWYTVDNLDDPNLTYTEHVIDLDATMARAGISYGDCFRIKFQQYGTIYTGSDVRAFDDVTIVSANRPFPPGISIDDITVDEGNSGVTNAVFTVSLTGPHIYPVSIDYNSGGGLADWESDYKITSGTLHFAVGETTKTISVPVYGDTWNERDDEYLTMSLLNPVECTRLKAHGRCDILDGDDGWPTMSIADAVPVTEGPRLKYAYATFNVTLSAASTDTITVDYATANGSASADWSDFISTRGTLTFEPGQTSQTITVTLHGDGLDEFDETFQVNLTSAALTHVQRAQAIGTIIDDDTDPPSLSITDVTVTEGNAGTTGNAIFTVTLWPAVPSRSVTANYTTASLGAIAGQDFTAVSGTLTFAPNQTVKTVSVPILGDNLDEATETFNLNLSNVAGVQIWDSKGIGTINDNDATPTLAISNVMVQEGSVGANVNATFTVTLSTPSGMAVQANFATAAGTATALVDFNTASGTVTFPAGIVSRTVTVTVKGDGMDETNETFFVNLTNAVNAGLADNQGLGLITDDDNPPSLSINDVTLTEGTGSTVNAMFTVKLSATSGWTVKVNYATESKSAVAGQDFTASSGTLTFEPGAISKTVLVPVTHDQVDEIAETFLVNLSGRVNASITDSSGVGTIQDNDNPPTVSIGSITVREGNSATTQAMVRVTLSAASGLSVRVNFASQDGSALAGSDYTAIKGVLTFAPGETVKFIPVPVMGDAAYEATESFAVKLSNALGAVINIDSGLVTIENDDTVSGTLSMTPDEVATTENAPFAIIDDGIGIITEDEPVSIPSGGSS